jgi:hypothetical protein
MLKLAGDAESGQAQKKKGEGYRKLVMISS